MTVGSATERRCSRCSRGRRAASPAPLASRARRGYPNFLSFDMGGTSTDVALCLGGEPVITRETKLGYFPLKSPTIDVRSVGAGGGSIAHVPEVTQGAAGRPRVGGRGAGSRPPTGRAAPSRP